MNDQTAKLLEQLATKLGTTSQYLWGILLKQAPIDATITLFQGMIIGIFWLMLYKIHKNFSAPLKENSRHNKYSEHEDYLPIAMIIIAILLGLLSIMWLYCINDIITGYFNPEYWALNKILDKIKN